MTVTTPLEGERWFEIFVYPHCTQANNSQVCPLLLPFKAAKTNTTLQLNQSMHHCLVPSISTYFVSLRKNLFSDGLFKSLRLPYANMAQKTSLKR